MTMHLDGTTNDFFRKRRKLSWVFLNVLHTLHGKSSVSEVLGCPTLRALRGETPFGHRFSQLNTEDHIPPMIPNRQFS